MKKVLITGATGFIGSHLVRELICRNVEVYALCNYDSPNLDRISGLENVHIIDGNMEELDRLPDKCNERNFDVFFHLAWKGASGTLRQDCKTQLDNIVWSFQAAETAIKMKCKKIVITGTVCENQCDAIAEMTGFAASSYYLNSKKSAYEMVSAYCKQHQFPLVWCTFYHPLGIYNKKEQLLINTMMKLLSGEYLRFGKAGNWFDVIAVEDLCRGLYLAGKHELKKDRYFIGSGTPRLLYEYLEEVKNMINPNAKMHYGEYENDNLPMKREWLDVLPFQVETGFQAEISFHDCVEQTLQWLKREMKAQQK
ncbi:MAG: NAD(P)-dependent oxidoreductase [Lachnospiraceae bacterium]|nr:NAD(P)-dependent oxidoreductase [Lachnospiraceae bacterium]